MLSLFRNSVNPVVGRRMASTISWAMTEKKGIAKLEMNDAAVNTLSTRTMEDFINKIDELKAQKDLRGVIITSGAKNVFVAGLNLAEVYQADPAAFRKMYYLFQEMNYQLYKAPFLTAAAINGHAPAGGCVMALTTDYRVMVNNPEKPFRIGLNETSLGMVAPVWVQTMMGDVIGKRQAVQSCLSSTLFTTEEAFRIGLVDEMADSPRDAVDKAQAYLDMYREMPIDALVETKKESRKDFIKKFESEREFDIANFCRFALGPVAQELLGQFMKGRK